MNLYSSVGATLAMALTSAVQAAAPITVESPKQFSATFTRAINEGNIEGLLSLYDDDATVVTNGTVFKGKTKIRENLQGFMSLGGVLDTHDSYVLTHNDIAVVRVKWRILDRNNRQKILADGESVEVLKRNADGHWVYLIDHPYGASPDAQAAIKD
jgi:uncharacterized protein (TIGR02246 family)